MSERLEASVFLDIEIGQLLGVLPTDPLELEKAINDNPTLLRPYSSDANAAIEVWEATPDLRMNYYFWRSEYIGPDIPHDWVVKHWGNTGFDPLVIATTLPLAICAAIKKLKGK